MFYLNIFFKTLKSNWGRSLGLLFSGLVLCFVLTQHERIQERIISDLPKVEEGPHFFALINPRVNSEMLRRKLMDLPGVKTVRNISEKSLKKQIQEVAGDIGGNLPFKIDQTHFKGLKIAFAEHLEVRSQALVRKYLSRLTGEKNITLGPTVGNQKEKGNWLNGLKESLRTQIGYTFLFFLSALYLSFGLGLSSKLGKESYLVERFSRRKNVVKVVAGGGFLLLFLLMGAPSFLMGQAQLTGLFIFFLFNLLLFFASTRRGWESH